MGAEGLDDPGRPARAVRATAAGGRRRPSFRPMTRRRYNQAEVVRWYVIPAEGILAIADA